MNPEDRKAIREALARIKARDAIIDERDAETKRLREESEILRRAQEIIRDRAARRAGR